MNDPSLAIAVIPRRTTGRKSCAGLLLRAGSAPNAAVSFSLFTSFSCSFESTLRNVLGGLHLNPTSESLPRSVISLGVHCIATDDDEKHYLLGLIDSMLGDVTEVLGSHRQHFHGRCQRELCQSKAASLILCNFFAPFGHLYSGEARLGHILAAFLYSNFLADRRSLALSLTTKVSMGGLK